MYSVLPLASVQPNHGGFILACGLCILILGLALNAYELPEKILWGFLSATLFSVSYYVSFHLTNQEPLVYRNEPVVADFVGFLSEGYNERSGKSRADYHYLYVIYSVGGQQIPFLAEPGKSYPKKAILYKN